MTTFNWATIICCHIFNKNDERVIVTQEFVILLSTEVFLLRQIIESNVKLRNIKSEMLNFRGRALFL